jgi:ribulose 1,5-bisphosphate carboxylase large subunit-like protein
MQSQYVSATYRVDLTHLSANEFERLAVDMTANAGVGTWTSLDLSNYNVDYRELQRDFGARLTWLDFETGIVRIAYPLGNIDPRYGAVPFLLNTVAGDVLGLSGHQVRLVDLELPPDFTGQFSGPNLGIEGVRRLLEVNGRPLLAFSIKPRVGLPMASFTRLCRDVLKGGADIVEDDTRLLETENLKLADRAKSVRQVVDELGRSHGKKLYSVNVTGRADKVVTVADQVIDAGANALKLDVLAAGYSALQSLTEFVEERHEGKVPIFVYPAMYSVFERSVDRMVLLRLARLCGADIIYAGTPKEAGRIDVTSSDVQLMQYHQVLMGVLPKLRRTMPSVAAGLHPGKVEFVKTIVGHNDFAYFIGGGIAAHPRGIEKGAELFAKAIKAFHQEEKVGFDAFDDDDLKDMDERGWRPAEVSSELKDRVHHLALLGT